jgi:Phosphatidylglycerol lysyltransferase, C-terminal
MKNHKEKQLVIEAVQRFGYQSQSYHVLGDDKSYFFSQSGLPGVIAYVVHAKVALGAGDPVCELSDLPAFIREFESYCQSQGWRCCFQAVTERCRDILVNNGFGSIKIGEEPFYDLKETSWDGGRFRGLRKDIRRGVKNGLTVEEYYPLSSRRSDWETQMEELSAAWEKFKGSGEFAFLLGGPSLSNPRERKYFLALLDDKVEAFVVCTPIFARNGIYFDLMRRKERPVSGTSQLLISESFRLLREQGYEIATLGTAPLSNQHVVDPEQSLVIGRALDLAYGRLKSFHRYKPIYEFKNQFGPTSWEGRHMVYGAPGFNPIMLYALLKAYDPSGITGKLSRQIHHAWTGVFKRLKTPVSASRDNISTALHGVEQEVKKRLFASREQGKQGVEHVEMVARRAVAKAIHEVGSQSDAVYEIVPQVVVSIVRLLVKAGTAGKENIVAVVRGAVEGALDEEIRLMTSAREKEQGKAGPAPDDEEIILEHVKNVLRSAHEASIEHLETKKGIEGELPSFRDGDDTPEEILKRVRRRARSNLGEREE